eukprot:COSAG05_NODE_473_length_9490_cov_16.326696_2_plen_154_part_00
MKAPDNFEPPMYAAAVAANPVFAAPPVQYAQPAQPQYAQPQFAAPQYRTQPQYGQPMQQYGQVQQPQYAHGAGRSSAAPRHRPDMAARGGDDGYGGGPDGTIDTTTPRVCKHLQSGCTPAWAQRARCSSQCHMPKISMRSWPTRSRLRVLTKC